jgi:hypothetical protein
MKSLAQKTQVLSGSLPGKPWFLWWVSVISLLKIFQEVPKIWMPKINKNHVGPGEWRIFPNPNFRVSSFSIWGSAMQRFCLAG